MNTNNKDIRKLLDTIQTCEVAVNRLTLNPPLELCYNELMAYKTEFNKMGAKALVDLYHAVKNIVEEEDHDQDIDKETA